MKLEIEKSLVISTRNITLTDSELLERASEDYIAGFVVYYLVYLSRDDISPAILVGAGFSEAFVNLYEFAVTHEERFRYLKIDRDGDLLEGFPVFDW